jgi:hypothetical protein
MRATRCFGPATACGAILFCSAFAHADCDTDNDCKGDRICVAGKCTDSSPATNRPTATPDAPATTEGQPIPEPPPTRVHREPTRRRAAETADMVSVMIDAPGRTAKIDDQSCAAPCSLQVPKGAHTLKLTDAPDQHLDLSSPVYVTAHHGSPTWLITGLVMVGISIPLFVLAFTQSTAYEACESAEQGQLITDCGGNPEALYLAVGGLILGTGILTTLFFGIPKLGEVNVTVEQRSASVIRRLSPWVTPLVAHGETHGAAGGLSLSF